MLQAIGGEAHSDMITKRLAELDERANQLEASASQGVGGNHAHNEAPGSGAVYIFH